MPYTVGANNLPKNVKELPKDKQAQWVETWNTTWKKARSEGKSPEDAEAEAFKIANGVIKESAKIEEASVTKGMANTMSKKAIMKCPECGQAIPKYPGRYPKYCPNCGAELKPEGKEETKESVEDMHKAAGDLLLYSKIRILEADDEERITKSAVDALHEENFNPETKKNLDAMLITVKESVPAKYIIGTKYKESAFAYVPDKGKPDTWKLRLCEIGGDYSRKQIDMAAAMLSPGGYRGEKADIPGGELPAVKSNIRAAYRELGISESDMPRWVEENDMERDYVKECGTVLLEEATADMLEKGIVPVRFLAPGFNTSKSKFYTPEAVRSAVEMFEGAKMFSDHPTAADEKNRPERSIRDWVGTLKNTRVSESGNGCGEAHIHEGWLKEKVRGLHTQGDLGKLGLSIIGVGRGFKGEQEGHKTLIVESVVKGKSVDFVTDAGAGGHAGLSEANRVEHDLDIASLADLKESRPDLVDEIRETIKSELEKESLTEVKKMAVTEKELKEAQDRMKEVEVKLEEATKEKDALTVKIEEADKAAAKAKAQDEIKSLVEKATTLPEISRKRILGTFAESSTSEGVQKAIDGEIAYLKELSGTGIVTNMGVADPAGDEASAKAKATELRESRVRKYTAEGNTKEVAERMADTYMGL